MNARRVPNVNRSSVKISLTFELSDLDAAAEVIAHLQRSTELTPTPTPAPKGSDLTHQNLTILQATPLASIDAIKDPFYRFALQNGWPLNKKHPTKKSLETQFIRFTQAQPPDLTMSVKQIEDLIADTLVRYRMEHIFHGTSDDASSVPLIAPPDPTPTPTLPQKTPHPKSPIFKICAICGTAFETTAYNTRKCPKCQAAGVQVSRPAGGIRGRPKICAICGQPFEIQNISTRNGGGSNTRKCPQCRAAGLKTERSPGRPRGRPAAVEKLLSPLPPSPAPTDPSPAAVPLEADPKVEKSYSNDGTPIPRERSVIKKYYDSTGKAYDVHDFGINTEQIAEKIANGTLKAIPSHLLTK